MAEGSPDVPVQKIVSGGQTGVDQGALDAAIALGLEHGGWCPRGRICEQGVIPARFRLQETDSERYAVRTERNVVDSDATLIVHYGPLTGGTALTAELAERHRRPCYCVDLAAGPPDLEDLRRWLREHHVRVLNVAGPRATGYADGAEQTYRLLLAVFGRQPSSGS